ncbi:phenylacetate-CoA oxygenase, PaaJ subunit [Roseibium sp. TrichSKD4]|nr:phenylacetate-CoA oxygenase, PaaJ subunit [Roseibium sp. TrichSKD4]
MGSRGKGGRYRSMMMARKPWCLVEQSDMVRLFGYTIKPLRR